MKTKRIESADNAEDGLLRDARVYLSGPMDFVASRAAEKATGWRTRIGQFLRRLGVIVFDPWEKPEVRNMHDYGREGEGTTDARAVWTYKSGEEGAAARAHVAEGFWGALHIDLRMVDTSDFIICYCPTNVYSVGTPHEIIIARDQRKPVLFVSPYVSFPALSRLQKHLAKDAAGTALLEELIAQVPIKENKNASPSKNHSFPSLKNLIASFRGSGIVPRKNLFQTMIGFCGICASTRRARRSRTLDKQNLHNARQRVLGSPRTNDKFTIMPSAGRTRPKLCRSNPGSTESYTKQFIAVTLKSQRKP